MYKPPPPGEVKIEQDGNDHKAGAAHQVESDPHVPFDERIQTERETGRIEPDARTAVTEHEPADRHDAVITQPLQQASQCLQVGSHGQTTVGLPNVGTEITAIPNPGKIHPQGERPVGRWPEAIGHLRPGH